MDVINPADEGGAAPPSTSTDVDATKAKTQRALLGGLRSGALEAAVAKMEEDTAAEDEAVSALSARLPVVTSAGQLRESRRVAAEETMAAPQAALTSKGSFGSRKAPKLKPVTSREATPAATEVITADTVLTAALMFRALDADASGGLDMTELKRLVDRLGVPTSEDQLRRMLESKLQRDLGAGEKPELDFEGFEAFIDPILDEIREADRNAAEEETRELAAPDGLPAGSFEASALGFLTLENPARRVAIKLVSKQAFDYVVLILIGINSVLMALEDPLRPPEDDPEWMARAELTFNILFTIEMGLKIFALGLVNGPDTYLQSPWNILDAVVVLTSWLPYILSESSSSGGAVRAFRLLRPLRTINRFPGLKRLVSTILMSIPQMQVLAIMVLIYVFTFAVVGVQLWQGVMLQRCKTAVDSRAAETCAAGEHELCSAARALIMHDDAAFCDRASVGASGWKALFEGNKCGQQDVCELHSDNPYDGVLNFDNFGSACIPVMQMVTVSSWQEVMHIMQEVTGDIATVYFLFGTVFGGYFLFNLFVAVLKSKFEIAMAVAAEGADLFEMVDIDGSGELDRDELDLILKNKGVFMTEEKLGELFDTIDTDCGGTIDMVEFTTWLRGDDILAAQLRERMDVGQTRELAHQVHRVNEALPKIDQIREKLRLFQPDNDWVSLFEYYDLDGGGAMGRDEFAMLLRRDIGMRVHQISEAEINEVFEGIDTKQSGDVDAEEFAAWVVEETVESLWVKVRIAITSKGGTGLRQLVANASKESILQNTQRASNFDDEITARLTRGAGKEMPTWKQNLRATLKRAEFRRAVAAMVVANTLVLALDYHGINRNDAHILNTANAWLTFFFACEMWARMLAYDWDEFFAIAGALPDLVMVTFGLLDVVTVSLVQWVIVADDTGQTEATSAARDINNVFIVIRVLRPLRLMYTLSKLEPVYRVCVRTFGGLVYIASLVGLFMFIFTVLGMQVFGGEFSDFEQKPRAHYDSFTIAFTTTFQIITFDSWQIVMYDAIRATGGWSAVFFIAWVVIGAMVMLNLLLVIILDVYVIVSHASDSEDSAPPEDDGFENPLRRAGSSLQIETRANTFDIDSVDEDAIDMNEGHFGMSNSCGIFSTGNRFRKLCITIAESQTTDRFVLLFIVANCITMAMDHPDVDPLSQAGVLLFTFDFIFTVVFTVEMCVRIVAVGFYQEDTAYLRGGWNRLDFAIVVVSWVDYLASALDIKFLRTLRLLRALRALRMFNRIPGLRVLIDSLLESVKALSATFTVTVIIFVAYAILGVTAFKGRFHRCTDAVGVSGIDTCVGTYVQGGALQNNLWLRPHNNFDNVANGMFTLFTVSTSNDWIVTAHLAVDAPRFPGQQPIPENAPWRIVYFMVFIMLVNFFFLNLFVGVIYGKYVDIHTVGMTELSKDQRHWLGILGQLAFARPQKDVDLMVKEKMGSGGLQAKAFDLVENKLFDHFIVGCIIANCVMMAATFYQEPQEWTDLQAILNVVFTLIFTVEMVLKLFAFGLSIYFSDSWCRFDCFVVVGSWADLVFTWLGVELFSSSLFRIIRISRVIGRIGRIFKLLGDSKSTLGLDEVMVCLYQALPQLAYIGILVSLILFIFAVLAMNLMGRLEHTGCIGPNTNFERAPIAALTLLGVATKDRITCTIHAAMVQPPYCDQEAGTCGTPGLPQVFFVLFSLVIMFTTLEMFVNVIIGSFEDLTRAAGLPITLARINQFQDSWKILDPRATGWIALSDLKVLFEDLPPQVGMDELAGEHDFDARLLRLIELPNGTPTRHLLGKTPQELVQAFTDEGVKLRIERILEHVFEADGRDKNTMRRSFRKSQDSGAACLTADRLHERLQSISGLTRAEVGDIVRLLDSGIADDEHARQATAEAGDGQVNREELDSGLQKLNEARLAGAVPAGRANEAMMKLIMGQLNFHEVLYAVCERKAGKPLPNTNEACKAARSKVGLLMPSIKNKVLADMHRNRGPIKTTPAVHALI